MTRTRQEAHTGQRYTGLERERKLAALVSAVICVLLTIGCGDGSAELVEGDLPGTGGVAAAGAGGSGGRGGGGASGEGGVADELAIAPISDQVVIRNFLEPRSFTFDVAVPGLDTAYSVAIASTDEAVIASSTSECTSNPCRFEVTPIASRNAMANVEVTVTSGDVRAKTSFTVTVRPRLVRNATDDDPPAPDSLRDVVARAEDGDIVGFDTSGAFANDTTIPLTRTLELDAVFLRFEGPAEPRVAIRSGAGFRAVHLFDHSEAEFSNVDFMGVRPLEGGLIRVDPNTRLELKDSTLRDGVAQLGGAIVSHGTLRIENCTFINNAANSGGAVWTAGDSAEIANTTFDSNGFDPSIEDTVGGGLAAHGPAVLIDVTFVGNVGLFGGGMMVVSRGAVVMRGGKIGSRASGGNEAVLGGGVYLSGGTTLHLESVRVEVNRAERGAGFYVDTLGFQLGGASASQNATLDIAQSQISQNFASAFGGGLFVDGGVVAMDGISAIGPENEAGIEDGGGGIYVTNGGDISGVPRERVNGNRAGPGGAESDINRDPNDF